MYSGSVAEMEKDVPESMWNELSYQKAEMYACVFVWRLSLNQQSTEKCPYKKERK